MGYLLLRILGSKFLKLYFVCSVFTNADCNELGQTSRLVAGAQIQTSCNFEKITAAAIKIETSVDKTFDQLSKNN